MRNTFPRGGIHPPDGKELTSAKATQAFPAPELLYLPLGQHLGSPSQSIVERGQRVLLGEKIAEAAGKLGVPVHATVSGIVKDFIMFTMPNGVKSMTVVLENDGQDTPAPPLKRPEGGPEEIEPGEIVDFMQEAGLVGMGGAAFPTYAKYRLPEGTKIDTIVVNGAECEPFLTCDHRLMLEEPEDLILGIRLMMRAAGAQRAIIGIEENKPDAISRLTERLADMPQIEVKKVKLKYPQGEERLLIKATTGRNVSPKDLPAKAGVIVNNVATVVALGQAFRTGMPLIERVVTVTGPGVENPGNWRVRLGTPVEALLEAAGWRGSTTLLAGGPMTASAIFDLKTPITKVTGGIVALDEETRQAGPCIRCGKCVQACPFGRMPLYFGPYLEQGRLDELEEMGIMYCRECGCCSYVCPAHRPILQTIRLAKARIRNRTREGK